MLFTKVHGTGKVTRDVIHPKTVLRRPKALYLFHDSEQKSFRERISFFLFRFTALMKYLVKFVHESRGYLSVHVYLFKLGRESIQFVIWLKTQIIYLF